MTARRLLSLALRESRFSRRRLFLFLSAISLGVAALVAVQGFASTMQREVREQARAMLGADVQLSSREPFGPRSSALLDEFAAEGIAVARVTSFASMARNTGNGATRLAQIRAVEPGFPFYGTIETAPAGRWQALHDGRNAVVDPALLVALDAEIGDTISVGETELTIIGTLERLPGDIEIASSFAPRVFMPAAYLDETALLGFGSRGEYEAFLRVDNPELAELIDDQYRPIWRAERVRSRTLREQQEQMDQALGSLGRYLGLVGVFALLLGGIGVASAMSAYMSRKVDSIAVLRCIGATSSQVFAIYLLQAAVMGFAGAVVGVLLGGAVQWLLPKMLTGLLPVDVPVRIDGGAAAAGLLVGTWAAIAFALLPLLQVRGVSPLTALRRRVEPLPLEARDPVRAAAWALLIASILLLIIYQAQSVGVGLAMAAGIGGTLLILWLAARAAAKALRRSPRAKLPYTVRQGIANLYRPGNQTVTVVLALGFGAFLIATLMLTQANILRPLAVNTETRFNLILLDVQADQVQPVQELLERRGVAVLQSVPLVSMRIAAVKGEPVRPPPDAFDQGFDGRDAGPDNRGGPRGWAVRREYRSTFRDVLTDSERLVAGEWWAGDAASEGGGPSDAAGEGIESTDAAGGGSSSRAGASRRAGRTSDGPYEVSLEQDIAAELGVGIGDRIDWDVQGVIVPTVVTSLRAVDWARLEPNFFAVFEPAALEAAPQMWVLLARGADANARALAQRDVVADHSNVSAIDLTLVQAALDEVIGRVSTVIRFLAGFSVATGFVVLLGAVATGRLQRIRESVLLKTLGATRRQIGVILLAEYAALGVLAAVVGAGLSLAAAWALAELLFDVPFAAELVPLFTLGAGVAVLSAVIGLSGSREVFRTTPMEALRQE